MSFVIKRVLEPVVSLLLVVIDTQGEFSPGGPLESLHRGPSFPAEDKASLTRFDAQPIAFGVKGQILYKYDTLPWIIPLSLVCRNCCTFIIFLPHFSLIYIYLFSTQTFYSRPGRQGPFIHPMLLGRAASLNSGYHLSGSLTLDSR
jgi:hypothetical protein